MTQPPTDELAQWRWQADRRWEAAREMFDMTTVPEEIVVENVHQAIERYLKWYLLARGWRSRKTHDLVELLVEAQKHLSALDKFVPMCMRLNACFLEERYPHPSMSVPDREQLQSDFVVAERMIKLLTT
jgi:HEPN domain-containing protein